MGYFFFNKNNKKLDYSPSLGESFGSFFGGIGSGIVDLFSKGLIGFLVIGVIVLIVGLFGAFILGRLGIIKADFFATMDPSVASVAQREAVSVVTVSHQKKPDIIITPVEAKGVTSFNTNTRCQSVFISYDEMMYDFGSYIIPGLFGDTNIECSLDPTRAVLVSFLDQNGAQVIPESLHITDTAANPIGCIGLEDGLYAFLLPEDASDMTLTFQVPNYAPVVVSQDWNIYRLGQLEVRLNG